MIVARPLTEQPAPTPAPLTARSRRILFSLIGGALFMSALDTTIVATALDAITHGLHATINWSGWTLTVYTLVMVATLPIAGRLGDQFGRRRSFALAVAVFTVASLACALSVNIYMLITFRAIQAVGAGGIQPAATGIVSEHFGKNRDRAIGLFGTVAASGQIIGPIFGGIFVGYLSWRWIFFINLPIGAGILLAMRRYIPYSPPGPRRSLDSRGLVLMAVLICALNLAITELGERGVELVSTEVLIPAAITLGSLGFFIHHLRTAPEPFIPVRLFKTRGFGVINTMNVCWGAMGFGMTSLVPLYAQYRYHIDVLGSGTLLSARGVGSIVFGAVSTFALRRTGYRLPLVTGFALVAIGSAALAFAPRWGLSPFAWISIMAGLTGVGNGVANPASRNAALQIAPDDVSAITGLRQMFNLIGMTFSVSAVTAILNRSRDPGIVQAHIFWVAAAVMVVVLIPLASSIPEHRGAW